MAWTRGDALGILSVVSVLVALASFCAVADGARLAVASGLALAFLSLRQSGKREEAASASLLQLSYLCSLVSVVCLVFAAWNLFLHPGPRWVHRFAIYSGYSATYGILAALARQFARRFQATVPWSRIVLLFLAIFAVSSLAIYLAKEQTVRCHDALMGSSQP